MQDLIEIQSSRYIVPELGKVAAFVDHATKPTAVPGNPPSNVMEAKPAIATFKCVSEILRVDPWTTDQGTQHTTLVHRLSAPLTLRY